VLRLAGERATVESLDDEYHELFVGIGRGEVVPYGSWYMTGFLMDQPLAVLRRDLQELGFERREDIKEPEDHVAALLETMGLMISDDDTSVDTQRRFFQSHMGPWMKTFFLDLQKASAARFYRAVGQFGEQFMEFEHKYLTMLV
jgi:TorA maturation chaperone TorD